MKNPYLKIADQAMEHIIKLADEFGMTPISRTRLAVGPEGSRGRQDPLDLFNQRRQAAKKPDPGRSSARRTPTGIFSRKRDMKGATTHERSE
jgi:hypothetical protein